MLTEAGASISMAVGVHGSVPHLYVRSDRDSFLYVRVDSGAHLALFLYRPTNLQVAPKLVADPILSCSLEDSMTHRVWESRVFLFVLGERRLLQAFPTTSRGDVEVGGHLRLWAGASDALREIEGGVAIGASPGLFSGMMLQLVCGSSVNIYAQPIETPEHLGVGGADS